jgi:antitoxin HicB
MIDYPITIVPLSDEDGGGFLGRALDLPGCMSDGETEAEALANTKQAIAEWIDECKALGREIPTPSSASDLLRMNAG